MEMDRSLFDPRVKWNGIGGWLLVFAIVLCLNTVPLFIQAFMILSILFSAHNGLLLLTCLVDFVYLGLLLASLILLLRHRIAFRWCYAAVSWGRKSQKGPAARGAGLKAVRRWPGPCRS